MEVVQLIKITSRRIAAVTRSPPPRRNPRAPPPSASLPQAIADASPAQPTVPDRRRLPDPRRRCTNLLSLPYENPDEIKLRNSETEPKLKRRIEQNLSLLLPKKNFGTSNSWPVEIHKERTERAENKYRSQAKGHNKKIDLTSPNLSATQPPLLEPLRRLLASASDLAIRGSTTTPRRLQHSKNDDEISISPSFPITVLLLLLFELRRPSTASLAPAASIVAAPSPTHSLPRFKCQRDAYSRSSVFM